MSRRFIVFADSFDENNGGVIALHRLCDLLNKAGREARLWPSRLPLWHGERPWASAWAAWRWYRRAWRRPYRTQARFDTPLATPADLDGAIVVYPEIVHGNPLRAERVVRWLLHKPGFHKGRYEYGPGDRYFFFQKAFDDPALNPDGDNLLKVVWLRDDVYRQTNFGERHGSCYFLRKGKGRPLVHELEGSVLADRLSHAELATLFNRTQLCVSYDSYTMYSLFAALCGCDSVVVPEPGVSKEQWYPDEADRYGLAYGFDDLEWARRTRHLLLPRLKAQETQANDTVGAFISRCDAYFP
ncbi:MAG: WavQ [Proteobacteria bacterium]|nr:WavQ [Pseudomonadota bacterium]